jgi:small GTP-binding protein
VISDNQTISISNGSNVAQLDLWDTVGNCEYDRLRPLTYPQTDAFLLVFDVSNPESLVDLQKFYLEVNHHSAGSRCVLVLVGCKGDLRTATTNPTKCIEQAEIDEYASIIGASYVECSSLDATSESIENVKNQICRVIASLRATAVKK